MADFGLVRFLGNGIRFATGKSASNYVGLKLTNDPASSFYLNMPTSLPGSTQAFTCDSSGNIGFQAFGSGTVTSVGLSLPNIFSVSNSPVTTSGTLTGTLATQSANTVWAGPTTGAAAAPTFRALVWADVSSLAGNTSTSFAAGNDSRFHTQNTDTGTTQTSFQIDSGNSGPRIKNSSGELQTRNAADSAYADFRCNNAVVAGNLTVQGTTTTVNSETVTIDDNIIVLNNNVSAGSPTEDGGIQIRRGASTSASLIWDETNDLWKAGVAGSEISLGRIYRTTFTNASLTAGVLTVTHNLGIQYNLVRIWDNNGKRIEPDDETATSTTVATIDLTSYGTLSGTWNVAVIG